MKPYFATDDGRVRLHLGDCLDVLPGIPDASIDAVICDPPYNLPGGFMSADWDNIGPGRQFQAWCEAWARECLRVLKPGGHLLAFGGTRTYHRLACGIEDAGFEIRDSIHWVYGQGFPKGQDIGKSIDKRRDDRAEICRVTSWLADQAEMLGITRQAIDAHMGTADMAGWWTSRLPHRCALPTPEQWEALRGLIGFGGAMDAEAQRLNARKGEIGEAWKGAEVIGEHAGDTPGLAGGRFSARDRSIRAAGSPGSVKWQGWNTSLKPSHEPVVVARKALTGTVASNVIEHGTGALNIDACRTAAGSDYREKCASVVGIDSPRNGDTLGEWTGTRVDSASDLGRWPANAVFTHSADCTESCVPGCPVTGLDREGGQSVSRIGKPRSAAAGGGWGMTATGAEYDDAGGVSRYFPAFRYEAKAPASERPRLADGTVHVSVKPLELMRWLVRLVTPPGGTVLDPFAGSGTTLEACVLEGFNAVGIEREPPYADLIVARLSKPLQPSLFGEAA